MKYKILKGTELFDLLTAVHQRMQKAGAKAKAIADEVGAEGYAASAHAAAGGIRGFCFKEYMDKKEGWRKLEKGHTQWFLPLSKEKSNKDLLKRISELPTVDLKEVSTLLKYETQTFSRDGGLAFSSCPGVEWFDDYILVSVDENAKFTPLENMIEITVSDYKKLQKDK